ncbi:Ras-like protein family member 11B, partial [Varanus komodoensis]
LLLAGAWGSLTDEGKAVATHSVTLVAAVTILIVSVFTSNAYGVLGSLLVGAAGLLAGTGLPLAVAARQGDILHGLMAAANLALCWALQAQHQELGRGGGALVAAASG